jgi:hypothetical protein
MARLPPPPDDLHEWVSFDDDDEDRTWVWDLTFLTSRWTCIYGNGCPGVLTAPAPELEHGCCSYGAHFTGPDDTALVEAQLARLEPGEWQFAGIAHRRGGPIYTNRDGETVSRLVDGACIFLNRPGWPTGAGCALHHAARARDESYLEWKPEVCWQAPMRRHDEVDVYGHVTSTVREWKRRDWGPGGDEFHWWCTATTEGADAFIADDAVYRTCRDELVAMTGERPYQQLVAHIGAALDRNVTFLPHPATRRRTETL